MISVWLKNPKSICLRIIVKMESLIRENTGKYPVKENGQIVIIMFRIMLMLRTKTWKYIFDTSQFPALLFCGSHPKPRGSSRLSKHYHLRFDPKLGRVIFAICRIPCACVGCTSMLDKPCISSIPSTNQARYQPVTNCTYWKVMGSYKNWNIT